MTSTVSDRPPVAAPVTVGRALRDLFLLAAGLAALHIVDDSFARPQPGTTATDHLVSGLVPLVALLLATIAFFRLGPRGRIAVAGPVGFFAVVVGVEGWYYTWHTGPSGDDITGMVAAVGGVALLLLSAVSWWRIPRQPESWTRRILRLCLVTAVGAVVLLQVAYPIAVSYLGTHVARLAPSPGALGIPYEDVEIVAPDGVVLRAWYVPSQNRAAVITYPGRGGALAHARLLARHGYGVLLVDRRGQGGSEGDPHSYGWGEYRDIAAAVDYLRGRPDVDTDRIGGIGFSVGAEVLLEATARGAGLSAVVAEGAGFRSLRELGHIADSKWLIYPLVCVATVGSAVFSDSLPAADLTGLVNRIGPRPVFLIHAELGVGGEELNPVYQATVGPAAERWLVPDSSHIGGLKAQPQEYERRVVAFFDRSLLGAR